VLITTTAEAEDTEEGGVQDAPTHTEAAPAREAVPERALERAARERAPERAAPRRAALNRGHAHRDQRLA